MDPSKNQDSQQKKPRKLSSISRRSVGAPAVASAHSGASPSCLSAASGAIAGGLGAAGPGTGGGTSGHTAPSTFWAGTSLGSASPNSSEWLYPPSGFVNSLQMPYLYPNGSQPSENFHFVGGPSSRGTPSPNDGTKAHETIDVDGDESLEPVRTDKRLNWSHEEDVRLVSLQWIQWMR